MNMFMIKRTSRSLPGLEKLWGRLVGTEMMLPELTVTGSGMPSTLQTPETTTATCSRSWVWVAVWPPGSILNIREENPVRSVLLSTAQMLLTPLNPSSVSLIPGSSESFLTLTLILMASGKLYSPLHIRLIGEKD